MNFSQFFIITFPAIKDACQNNEEFRSLTQKIQLNLGFKLKLYQNQGHSWTAKFLFDSKEMESNHFVVVVYNAQDDSFMRPYLFHSIIKFIKMI